MHITKNNLIKLTQREIDDLVEWSKRILAPKSAFSHIVLLGEIEDPQDMLISRVALLLEGLTKADHDLHAERFWGVVEERERYLAKYGFDLPVWTYDPEKRKDGIERWQGPQNWGWAEKHIVRVTVTADKIRKAMAEVGVDLSKLTINTSHGPRPFKMPDSLYGDELVAAWREHRRKLSAGTRAKTAQVREQAKAEMALVENTDAERARLMEANLNQAREIARLRAMLSERNVDSSQIKQLEKDRDELVEQLAKLSDDNANMAAFIAKVTEERLKKERQDEIAVRAQTGIKGQLTRPRGYRVPESVRDVPICFHDYIIKGEAA
jgi:hypothetical protein